MPESMTEQLLDLHAPMRLRAHLPNVHDVPCLTRVGEALGPLPRMGRCRAGDDWRALTAVFAAVARRVIEYAFDSQLR
jgi:hypothetical protein